MSIPESLALHLGKLADERNLSIRKLAEKTGTPHSTINNLVENRRSNPTLMTLLAIAAGLGISMKELFDIPELEKVTPEDFAQFKYLIEKQNSERQKKENTTDKI